MLKLNSIPIVFLSLSLITFAAAELPRQEVNHFIDPNIEPAAPKFWYAVNALPPEHEVEPRLMKLMDGLRSAFGGPVFAPHITVVGLIELTEKDAVKRFRAACHGLRAYTVMVDRVATGADFWQCLYLLIRPTPEVMEASSHCSRHFGYNQSTPYVPHLSLLYGDLSDEEKKAAQEMTVSLDETITCLTFPISRLALYKIKPGDKTCRSWEVIAESTLSSRY